MSHWEIVHTTARQPWHARLVSNGRIIMSTENYSRRNGALTAVAIAADAFGVAMSKPPKFAEGPGARVLGQSRLPQGVDSSFDVRYVDERDR